MPSSSNAKPLKRPVRANSDANCFQAIHKREDRPGLIKSRVEDLLETQAGRGFTRPIRFLDLALRRVALIAYYRSRRNPQGRALSSGHVRAQAGGWR